MLAKRELIRLDYNWGKAGAHDVGVCVRPPQHLRQELELKFYEDRFDWDQVRQNDAAGLLKMFIRELPNPLLTQQHLPAFTAAQSESGHQICVSPRTVQCHVSHLSVCPSVRYLITQTSDPSSSSSHFAASWSQQRHTEGLFISSSHAQRVSEDDGMWCSKLNNCTLRQQFSNFSKTIFRETRSGDIKYIKLL